MKKLTNKYIYYKPASIIAWDIFRIIKDKVDLGTPINEAKKDLAFINNIHESIKIMSVLSKQNLNKEIINISNWYPVQQIIEDISKNITEKVNSGISFNIAKKDTLKDLNEVIKAIKILTNINIDLWIKK